MSMVIRKSEIRIDLAQAKRTRPIVLSVSALMAGVKQTHDSPCAFCNKKGHETSHCANAKDKSSEDQWKIAKDKIALFQLSEADK